MARRTIVEIVLLLVAPIIFTAGSLAQSPVVSSLSPTSGVVGTQVTINGSGFGTTRGSSNVSFNGWGGSVVSWSATQIVATVPSNATTGPVTVTVSGTSSNTNVVFTMPNPAITSLSPNTGAVGTSVTVNGTGFGDTQGTSTVKLNGVVATVISWSATQIVVTVPNTISGSMIVTEGGVASSGVTFTVPAPQITSISPTSGVVGTQVTINGSGFGPTSGTNSSVNFVGGYGAAIASWSSTQIVATVPQGAVTGSVTVTVNTVGSNTNQIFTMPDPVITSLSPNTGAVGTSVTINGTGLGSSQGTSTVKLNGVAATVTSWSATQIVATVPNTISGSMIVTEGGVASNRVTFTVPPPQITSISPTSGGVGTQVTINGSGFGPTQGSS